MSALRFCLRAQLRSRLRAWIATAVLAGVAGGVVIALAAAAHRTATAYHRYLDATGAADAYVDPGFAFGGDESLDLARIARLPQVAAAQRTALDPAISQSRSGRPLYPSGPGAVQYLAPLDGRARDAIDRPKLLRGRLPDPRRPGEALADTKALAALGLGLGGRVTLRVATHDTLWHHTAEFRLTADPRTAAGGPLATVRVVGVAANARAAVDGGQVRLTPAFYRVYGGRRLGAFVLELEVRLARRHADLPVFEAAVQRIAGRRPYGFFEPTEGRVQIQRSISLLAVTLRMLAIVAGAAALLLVGQALVRAALAESAAHPTLRALGMTRRQLVALAAARAVVIGLPAAALAVALAVAVSPLTPVGWARELEPAPGFSFDAAVAGTGAAAVLGAVLAAGTAAGVWATRARRPAGAGETVAAALGRAPLGPPAAAGLRMALSRRGPGGPVGTTLAAAILAVTAAVTALSFAASLQHLLHTPRLYGRTWDFEIAGGGPPLAPAFVHRLAGDRALAGVAIGVVGPVRVGGVTTGANAMDAVKGAVPPTLLAGRAPRGTGELLLGTKTAARLGRGLGDTVEVASGGGRARLRLVGLGVVPATKWSKLGEGAALSFAALRRIQPAAAANAAEIRLAPGGGRAAALTRLLALADGPSSAVTPDEVASFGGVARMPLAIAAAFGLAAAAALAHALLASVRRRRRELALLKTLGFTRGQLMAAIAWQASTVAAVGLLAGLPLGLGLGRFAWNVFARDLGVVPEAVVPLAPAALVIPAALLLANLIAALPALTAARTRPALVLRAE